MSSFETIYNLCQRYGCGMGKLTANLAEDVFRPDIGVNYKRGDRVLIWTASRFGDIGITTNISKDCIGYNARVSPDILADIIVEKW